MDGNDVLAAVPATRAPGAIEPLHSLVLYRARTLVGVPSHRGGVTWLRQSSRNASSSSRSIGTTGSSSACASRRSCSGSLGFTLATIGAWGSVLLWGISAAVGLLQNWIYSETAAMFPDKPGGISLYAHEGWRSRFTLFGPIGAFGYWIGWSVVLSFFGNIVGALIVAEWFPSQATKVYFNLGFADFGLAQLIAVVRDPGRLAVQRLRRQAVADRGLRHRGAADDPAGDLHHHAVLHRGLASAPTSSTSTAPAASATSRSP